MKILVIRLGAIGDVVLTSAALRTLRAAQPDAEIHYLVKQHFAFLLAECPYINRLHTYDPKAGSRQLLKTLRSEHFDFVVDLQRSLRTVMWRMLLCRPSSALHKCNLQKSLVTSPLHLHAAVPHVALRYIEACAPLHAKDDGLGLELFMKPASPPLFAEPYVALVFGAAHCTKRITPEGVSQLCSHLSCRVVIVGDQGDAATLAASGVALPPNADNRCGTCSFEESAAIVSHAAVVVSSDTGLMHVAAAARRPVVAVWGSTSPLLGFAPFRTQHTDVQVGSLRCHPCGKLGFDRCPKHHFRCMAGHDWQRIACIVESLITKHNET
ncbi:MAG: glycosyltransferase family 9 protein [Bacteroidales bacterium]|nr:glycosyltransferase family 9 protein [Bacteroidales bacterium]